MPRRLVVAAAAVLVGLVGGGITAAPAAAQNALSCYAIGAGVGTAAAETDAAAAQRTIDAERALALTDLAAGRPFAAINRLERFLAPGTATAAGAGAALATLAIAYERVGCRIAAVAVSNRAVLDSIPARELVGGPTTNRALTAVAAAWAAFTRGDHAIASAQFGAAADATPGVQDRLDLRLLQAEEQLRSGGTARAATVAQAAVDSARALLAQAEARFAAAPDAATLALARAAASRRALGLLWAPYAAAGRAAIAGAAPTDNFAPIVAISASQVDSVISSLGASANDALGRALLWTTGDAGLSELRAAHDSLREADARVGRATARVSTLRAGRPAVAAASARYVAAIRRQNDSLAVAEAGARNFAAQLAVRDSAIGRAIADYRSSIDAKIRATRDLASQNLQRIDSLGPLARAAGAVTTRFFESEQGTATEYRASADVVASALEARLVRVDIVTQRDTARAKHRALLESLASRRAEYDAALAAALAAEREAAAAADRAIATAEEELRAAALVQTAALDRAAASAAAVLTARAAELKARLARVVHAASYAAGTALFFATIEGDTIRAPAALNRARRDAAIAALTEAVTAHAESPLRSTGLVHLGELLARKGDAEFAASQAGGAGPAQERPDYSAAIARFDEFIAKYPAEPRLDVAAYTLGTLAFGSGRYDDATRAFQIVARIEGSPYRAEAYFRNGDAQFEQAAKLAGETRRALLAGAADAYDRAIALAPAAGDIYFLSLYKLGWSNYMQAERQNSDEYRRAVDVFARLVREVDQLPAAQQARLALRQEAIDYLAIAITQMGGAEEAVRFLGTIPDVSTRVLVLRRVAHALRDQGEFNNAIIAFRGALEQAPLHSATLESRLELVDLFQSRMLEPRRAQEARLEMIDGVAPGTPWAQANVARAAEAQAARERILRDAGGFALSEARKTVPVLRGTAGRGGRAGEGQTGTTGRVGTAGASAARPMTASAPVIGTTPESQAAHAAAAALFARYVSEFSAADSAQRMSILEGDARFGARDWFASGAAYSRTAARWSDSTVSAAARRNAVIAFDSALASERRAAPRDSARVRAVEDSLFAATESFVTGAAPDDAKSALISKGRRASESARWDVVADAFTRVADRFPADPFVPDARKIVGDAKFRLGQYQNAQGEWRRAQQAATAAGRAAFADSVVSVRIAAAASVADSLTKRGAFIEAADSILGPIAAEVPNPTRAADVMRNAVEIHLAADSTFRVADDTAGARASKLRAIGRIEALAARYPTYVHTLSYNALRARLLSDVGRPADAADALQALAAANATWTGRADAMVRAAVILDSIGQPAPAAAAFERFSAAYPADKRAADAQYNAAVILRDGGDQAGAARAFQTFASRFPREPRLTEARLARLAALRSAGDSTTMNLEMARLCAGWTSARGVARPSSAPAAAPGVVPAPAAVAQNQELNAACADRSGAAAFRDGMNRWDAYAAMVFEIKTPAQLTRDGVAAASAPKLAALRTMNAAFARAVASGAPEWVAAGSFQSGLAQWHYGLFLRDVVLPAALSDAQRSGAINGSAQQAQAYFDAAIAAWTALTEKAAADKFENAWVEKARAALGGDGVPQRVKP